MPCELDIELGQFLSRLCGGEDDVFEKTIRVEFLSRLCGGEGSPIELKFFTDFSKPPMWR